MMTSSWASDGLFHLSRSGCGYIPRAPYPWYLQHSLNVTQRLGGGRKKHPREAGQVSDSQAVTYRTLSTKLSLDLARPRWHVCHPWCQQWRNWRDTGRHFLQWKVHPLATATDLQSDPYLTCRSVPRVTRGEQS